MSYFIYCIECVELKRQYIGSTNDIKRRYSEHISMLENNSHPNYKLQDVYNKKKYTFRFKVLERIKKCTKGYILKREQYYIDKYIKTCFNLKTVWDEDLKSYLPRLIKKRKRNYEIMQIKKEIKEMRAKKRKKNKFNKNKSEIILLSQETLSKIKKVS